MNLSQLIQGIANITEQDDRYVTGLSSDSREISQGQCFVALKGYHVDGRDYISTAIQKGASVVLVDAANPCSEDLPIPLVTIPDLSLKLGEIAARYYQHPSSRLTTIGVTGTNGKTSTSQCLATALQMANLSCGVIGTMGYGLPGQLQETTNTTGNPLVLQKQLADICQLGAKAVAMEVSSHALDQHRTEGIEFDMAIFTNLTRDHLDYHGTMENYAQAKKKLFYMPGLKHAVINVDDHFGHELARELANKLEVYGYGMNDSSVQLPTVRAHHVHMNNRGVTAKVSSPWGEGLFKSKLLGRFNISNLLAVLTSLCLLDIPLADGLELLANLNTVTGRMEMFGGGKLPLVVVDYAHTPDALMQVLVALREHTHGKLWCLFGCGGDRDRGKRPLMGQIAERYADQLVITDDNPRTEDPNQIATEIISGLLCPWAVEVEHDRGAAIAHMISCAQPGDVILVAGKGHENYQIVGEEKILFSDRKHIEEQLRLKQIVK